MNEQTWWERWPSVLEREENALRTHDIAFTRNQDALVKGVMRIDLVLPSALGGHQLFAVFPDDYPYFRFQVYAPELSLRHHQNPFEHNLCLIGRRTHWWNPTDTLAEILMEQFPKLLATANATSVAEAAGQEEEQAEPFSDYYRFNGSMILVDPDWVIGQEHRSGYLKIGTIPSGDQLPDQLIRGAILEVESEARISICSADSAIRRAFSGKQLEGRWVRVGEVIKESHEGKFFENLLRLHPSLQAKPNHVKDGWLRIWGVLFPEETAHHVIGEGWMFACAVDKDRPQTVPASRSNTTQKKKNRGGR